MAASLPPLKATFESFMRSIGLTSGLVTSTNGTYGPGGTSNARRSAYGNGTFRSAHQPHRSGHAQVLASMGGDEEEAYELGGRKSRARVHVEPAGMQEDQKHILASSRSIEEQNGGGGWGITKTTEYSVSDEADSVVVAAGDRPRRSGSRADSR
jgi:hypothetical protein